ncbi:cytochrome b/b6 domain-containing protein [Microbacterium aurantiacum]|uniref:cytochrome b/b6 domain-containing protein n=3 Tax=Microbacterium aurantiacum TaxID=162393 RepID=UPI00341AE0AF
MTGPQATPEAESIAPVTDAGLRRGLPRVPGGEPWPPASASRAAAPETPAPAPAGPETAEPTAAALEVAGEAASDAATRSHPPLDGAAPARDLSVPLPFTPTVWAGASATARPTPRPEPRRFGPFTALQWLAAVVIGGAGLIYAAGMLVVAVRWLVSTAPVQEFLVRYPGEYHLPEGAPVGIPAWLAWQHFFNVFLMVLIIRTGLRVRTEKRPDAFWSPRGAKKRKTSLNIWFHQSLDVLWVVNGIVFVVLLFATGQWMRIVPTSWEVFPNLLSAGLQYVSLDWPTENGWVNYNSLQQLAYFSTVFIAAPLAIITGIRMSMWWPKNAPRLNKAYPVEWARKLHFPVMLYFVVFIIIHVALVFATGALRNLNHMYAAQGSVDPDAYATNWTGFWLFTLSMAVIAAAWVAARPMVLAPIARLFGTVSSR